MAKILPVIMCGGTGTRVWPESRESLPKQFIPLVGDSSTFQMIASHLCEGDIFQRPIIITNSQYRFRVAEQLEEIGASAQIVLEPMARDSAPAIAVAAEIAFRADPSTVVAVFSADHVFQNFDLFRTLCAEAGRVAAKDGAIVTFGVKPDHPATSYGYIKPGKALGEGSAVRAVAEFVEKPDEAKAAKFIVDGYLWNSGNFVFRADVMLDEMKRFEPAIAKAAHEAVEKSAPDLGFCVLDHDSFAQATKKSIDFAVMERTSKAAVIEADVGWSDVGLWSTVLRLSKRDANGNSLRGKAIALDSKNVLVRSDDQLTAVVGLKDVIVITTRDAVLVIDAKRSADVKQLVDRLKAEKHKEATEHKRGYRPWGYYQSVDIGDRYQVKRIVVKSGGRLSLQKHFHRSEHWIVVQGVAEVTLNGKVQLVHENESIYLPIGCEHRLANPGKIKLELIEVQTGSYFGEDDIIRLEDVYHRT